MTHITICMGSSCFARGNGEHLASIEAYVAQNELDARIDLRGCRCRGECARGPCIDFDGTLHTRVDRGVLGDILDLHLPTPALEARA